MKLSEDIEANIGDVEDMERWADKARDLEARFEAAETALEDAKWDLSCVLGGFDHERERAEKMEIALARVESLCCDAEDTQRSIRPFALRVAIDGPTAKSQAAPVSEEFIRKLEDSGASSRVVEAAKKTREEVKDE